MQESGDHNRWENSNSISWTDGEWQFILMAHSHICESNIGEFPPFYFHCVQVKGQIKQSLPLAKQINILASCRIKLVRTGKSQPQLNVEMCAVDPSKRPGADPALLPFSTGRRWPLTCICDCALTAMQEPGEWERRVFLMCVKA